jgi:hypothetical protein
MSRELQGTGSAFVVVRVSGPERKRPVELFHQDQASQLVGHGLWAEADALLGLLQNPIPQPETSSDDEDQLSTAMI